MNAYVEEIHKQEQVRTSTKQLCVILDDKYEKTDLNKVAKNKCQHLIEKQHNEQLKLLQKSKSCSMEHLALGKHIQQNSN